MRYVCQKHTDYKGKLAPRCDCVACWVVYIRRLEDVNRIRCSIVRTRGEDRVIVVDILLPKPRQTKRSGPR